MKYPIGIQNFEKIRNDGYVYVDKTALIYRLADTGSYYFLSRPRRFGKSVLVDTLQAYFEGKKELFEGLKIMDMEKNWTARPVIRLDMSRGDATVVELRAYLDRIFAKYEKVYGIQNIEGDSLSNRFDAIITTAYGQTGQQVAILIDE